jgi:hypothetical protein
MLLAKKPSKRPSCNNWKKILRCAENERQQLTQEWTQLWHPLGIDHRSPREMVQWANDFKYACPKSHRFTQPPHKKRRIAKNIDAHRLNLIQHVFTQETKSSHDNDSLTTLIKKAKSIITRKEELLRKREQLLHDQRKLEKELKAARSRLESSEKELSDWKIQWEKAVRPIGLNADAQPEEANVVMDELKNLFDKIKEAEILQKRIIGIDRDREAFIRKVTSLIEVVARDLANRPAPEAALELHHRLKQSREARTKKETLEKQLEQERRQLNKAIRNSAELEIQLKSMCEEAGCRDIDQLPEAEHRSSRRREIQIHLETNDDQLRRLSGGATVEEFIKETLEVDPDSIAGEILTLEETIETLTIEKSELDQTIGSEKMN